MLTSFVVSPNTLRHKPPEAPEGPTPGDVQNPGLKSLVKVKLTFYLSKANYVLF